MDQSDQIDEVNQNQDSTMAQVTTDLYHLLDRSGVSYVLPNETNSYTTGSVVNDESAYVFHAGKDILIEKHAVGGDTVSSSEDPSWGVVCS